MKTLTTPVNNEAAASQSGWCEVYDIYLKAAITTPMGTTDTLRICTFPGGFNFFKPKIWPETDQGAAQAYTYWPMQRDLVKGDSNFTTDKIGITASNVTGQWAQMLSDVDWYDVQVIIRKVPTVLATPTADDCVILFSGFVDGARTTLEMVQLACSNDLSSFATKKPAEPMHANCRFRWGDDWCTALRYLAANYKSKTAGSGSTTTIVFASGLTEDSGARASLGTDRIDSLADAAITATSNFGGFEPYKVRQSTSGSWRWSDLADWGTAIQGAFYIPTLQAGLKNPLLEPMLQFDFGSARRLKTWRIKNNADVVERLARVILIFSSPDKTVWKFETYHELPALMGVYSQINIPDAASERYWRICIRSRWVEVNFVTDFENVEAYEDGRNYWAHGLLKFASNTTTAALRNISRTVLESYSGEVSVMPLPVAPVSGDTFTIERGCPRTFNGCSERLNVENFGGFDSMVTEAVR